MLSVLIFCSVLHLGFRVGWGSLAKFVQIGGIAWGLQGFIGIG